MREALQERDQTLADSGLSGQLGVLLEPFDPWLYALDERVSYTCDPGKHCSGQPAVPGFILCFVIVCLQSHILLMAPGDRPSNLRA